MSQHVVIDNVISEQGRAAIFSAVTMSGRKMRFVANADVLPRTPVAGEVWQIGGMQRRHKAYGLQVHVNEAALLRPSGRLIVRTLSASPKFPGIGEKRAQLLWDELGEEIYGLLDRGDVPRLAAVVGGDLASTLVEGWRELEAEGTVYRWLERHGLPVWLAHKCLNIWGPQAADKLEENPYRLLAFTSWKHADRVGQAVGVPMEDPRREIAAVEAACYGRLNSGHTWVQASELATEAGRRLNAPTRGSEALQRAFQDRAIIGHAGGFQPVGPWSMERHILERVQQMLNGQDRPEAPTMHRRMPSGPELQTLLAAFEGNGGLKLNASQREAVNMAVTTPFSILSGGAGVGKTTVLRAVNSAAARFGARVFQMALSGRAALRIAEATQCEARTIAGFLQANWKGQIELGDDCLLVVDEASMLDLPTLYRIVRAMPPGCSLLLVGDPGQLPPIGFGLTFHALVEDGAVPHVQLSEVHRQAACTGIPQASLDIREGRPPALREFAGATPGVTWVDASPDDVVANIMQVAAELGGVGAAQIIGAVKGGPAGITAINAAFHALMAPGRPVYRGFAEGEPIIWTVNDWDRRLLNGSLGHVESALDGLTIEVDGEEHQLSDGDLEDMLHAYAITCHRAQGSQFKRVIVPVTHSRILDRTMLYTAVTRAQEQVVLVGDREAFEHAVRRPPFSSHRQTGMCIESEAAGNVAAGVRYSMADH